MKSLYDISTKSIDGEAVSMSKFKDKLLLIVNVASECGFTKQYEGLQNLYEKYNDRGFEVLGFPCNQFGAQEPGTESEIKKFCSTKFNVNFPLFSKIEVNGKNTHPLYEFLKNNSPGLLGSKSIKWNFTKFLVSRDGEVLKRFPPTATANDIESDISSQL